MDPVFRFRLSQLRVLIKLLSEEMHGLQVLHYYMLQYFTKNLINIHTVTFEGDIIF